MKYAMETFNLTKQYRDFLAVDALNMKIDIPIITVEGNHDPIIDITRSIIQRVGSVKVKMRFSHV